jgi:hypothetical protein
MAWRESASFGEVVRCFSNHGAPQNLSAPDLCSLRNGSNRAPVNRVRRPSVFCARRLTQHRSWNSAHRYISSRTLTPNDLECGRRRRAIRENTYWHAIGALEGGSDPCRWDLARLIASAISGCR